jgi:hypothetical protein
MDVYLIPVGADAYEPYCEIDDDLAQTTTGEARQGIVRRLVDRFRAMLAAVEAERRGPAPPPPPTLTGRLKRRALHWIAERVAEQRLLWHLRLQEEATLMHPDDITGEAALDIVRASLKRDGDRHRWWLLVDGLLLIASGALVLVPGPNVLAYFFAFRLVGHFLSWRGARNGLDRVRWTTVPNAALVELRAALAEDRVAQRTRVADVARRLHLTDLPRFFERMTLERA